LVDDAILTFLSDVQTAWNSGKVTSALTFDIKGYFDFVNHKRLLCELRRKNLPLEYVKWTASFLSDREAAICIDGRCGVMQPVENGIPQGSPVSPILAAYL
jgi:retron-type reverse transcriptase